MGGIRSRRKVECLSNGDKGVKALCQGSGRERRGQVSPGVAEAGGFGHPEKGAAVIRGWKGTRWMLSDGKQLSMAADLSCSSLPGK